MTNQEQKPDGISEPAVDGQEHQQPVVWMYEVISPNGFESEFFFSQFNDAEFGQTVSIMPLYTAPPALEAENKRLRRQLEFGIHQTDIDRLHARATTLEAENKRLRKALEKIRDGLVFGWALDVATAALAEVNGANQP